MSPPYDSRPGGVNTTEATSKPTYRTDDQNIAPGYQSDHFVQVPVWLFGRVSLRSVGVYAGLKSYAFEADSCSPTEAEVARRLGVSAKTIKRARPELIEAKAIQVAVGRGATGGRLVYTFRPRPARTRDGWAKVPVALLGRVCPAAVGLYGVLRSFEGDHGVHPKVNTIAKRAGICHTQAKDYLRILKRAGAIEVIGRVDDSHRTTSNLYHFALLSEQTRVVADQNHAATDLVTNPAQGWCQIPTGDGDKSRPQTRTINKNNELEVVGWSAPSARVSSGELYREHLRGTGEGHKGPGSTSESLGVLGALGRKSLEDLETSPPTTARLAGWHRQPMPDEDQERQAQDLVDLLAEGLADLGRNAPAPAVLENWCQTARVTLFGPDNRDYDQARQLISKVCRDEYWSGQVRSLYYLAENWDQIADEFSKRDVRDVGVARAAKRRKQRTDKRVAERNNAKTADKPEGSGPQGIGCFRLSDL